MYFYAYKPIANVSYILADKFKVMRIWSEKSKVVE